MAQGVVLRHLDVVAQKTVYHIEPRFAFLGASCIGKRLGPIKIMEGYARGWSCQISDAQKPEKIEKEWEGWIPHHNIRVS